MAFQFPAAPTIGQLFSPSAGVTYQWNGYAWIPTAVNPTSPISYGERNRMINPAMRFDQVKEGAAYSVTVTGVETLDAWRGISAVAPGVFSVNRELSGMAAGNYNILATVTTPDAALGATDQYMVYSAIEGYDVADLYSGFSSSANVVVSFDVMCSIAGTFAGCIINNDGTRSYPFQYTIVTPGVVQRVNVALKLDETGVWLTTNGVGLSLVLTLGSGSNFTGTANTWQAGNKQTVAGSTNLMATGGATLRIGAVDFYKSQVARLFEAPDYQSDLAKVQRYYAKTFEQGIAVAQNVGLTGTKGELISDFASGNNAGIATLWNLPVTMRSLPTGITYSPSEASPNFIRSDGVNPVVATIIETSTGRIGIIGSPGTATTVNNFFYIHATANARLS